MGPEARVEARCCVLALRWGCRPVKLGGFVVGLPDRAILLPGGGVWLVEFKSLGGSVSARQKHLFLELAKIGHPVSIVRTADSFARGLARRLNERLPLIEQLRLDLP